jgi:hypothetical protein
MKSATHDFLRPAGLLLAGLLVFASHRAAAAASPVAGKGTNAPALPAPIPLAEFDVTNSPVKDPFYPNTTRSPVPVKVVTSAPAASAGFTAASFQLKGLSGPPSARLATINNKTVAVGEDTDIILPGGKVKIHCVEIKEDSVVILAGAQSQLIELHFRKGY